MVLLALVEALGMANAPRYVEHTLVPFFHACGVLAQGSSSDIPHGMPLDDPQQTLDNPRRRLDECMGGAIEEYEAIVARSKGLVRGRTAWNDGRECWLVDFPLVVLVVKPKKRERRPVDDKQAAKKPRRSARDAASREADQTVASQDVAAALAGVLGTSAAAMPPLRKVILEREQVASVYDAIAAIEGHACNPKEEYRRLAERYPEVGALCDHFQLSGQGQRETPVANAKTLVQIILLLPGEQAAKIRTEASMVFVDFLGGTC